MERFDPKLSVVVCTYNRAGLLEGCLKSLAEQSADISGYEVIVVDNNSTDKTQEVANSFIKKYPNFRYVKEPEQGLSHARNRGVKEARGEIVAFIDDDAIAEKNWLSAILFAFEDPSISCIGGRIELLWLAERPDWLTDDFAAYLGLFDRGERRKTLTFPDCPRGGNMAYRKIIFDRIGNFAETLGRVGNSLISNEEIEFCFRIEKAVMKSVFIPDALVYHHVTPNRLTKEWFYRRAYSQGCSDAILDLRHGCDMSVRLKYLAINIFNYHSSTNPDFSAECSYNLALGYIKQMVEASFVSGQQEDILTVFQKIFKSLYADKDRQIQALDKQIQALLNSYSWRITAPLRRIFKLLR